MDGGEMTSMNIRNPAVAGLFYPGSERELVDRVDGFMAAGGPAAAAKVAVMPHAGYVYSGRTAGAVAARVDVPRRVIILGPKHRRAGARAAVASADGWSFPFGAVPVDKELCASLLEHADLEADDLAHREEHSLEVEVPFLWRRNPAIAIAPVVLGVHSIEELEAVGTGIARAVAAAGEPVLIVASTDMSHQIPIGEAAVLDGMAIDRILALDPEGLYDTVFSNDISMCGVIPVTAALFAACALGASTAELIAYTTSADASGDTLAVVGYAGIVID
jgi:AmmeMemoRadiSam system protein B